MSELQIPHTAAPRTAGEARALAVARRAHAGQIDKAGRDYFEAHVVDVVSRLDPVHTTARIVAWLHDVLEDTNLSASQIREWFGQRVTDAVVAITHLPNEPRSDYYRRVDANPYARRVKYADIASNTDPARMALLDEATRQRLVGKYAAALEALS